MKELLLFGCLKQIIFLSLAPDAVKDLGHCCVDRVLLVLALQTPFIILQFNLDIMCKTKLNKSFSFPYLTFFSFPL